MPLRSFWWSSYRWQDIALHPKGCLCCNDEFTVLQSNIRDDPVELWFIKSCKSYVVNQYLRRIIRPRRIWSPIFGWNNSLFNDYAWATNWWNDASAWWSETIQIQKQIRALNSKSTRSICFWLLSLVFFPKKWDQLFTR